MKRVLAVAVLLCLQAMAGTSHADSRLYGDPTSSSSLVASNRSVSGVSSDVVVRKDRGTSVRHERVTYSRGGSKSFNSLPVGSYSNGCLINGIQANSNAPYYQLYHPQNNRHFGDITLLNFLDRYSRAVHKAGIESVLVGDMSSRYGGPFNKGHASHQIGLDVDIEFSLRRLPKSKLETKGNAVLLVDRGAMTVNSNFNRKYYDMLMIAAHDPEVERIFVNPAIKVAMCDMTKDEREQPYLRKIRPWFGHAEHFHVRLKCPAGAVNCVRQDKPEPRYSIAQEKEEALSWFEPKQEVKPAQVKPADLAARLASAKPKPKQGFPEQCSIYYQSMNVSVPVKKSTRR